MSLRDIILCILIVLFWGFNYVTVKIGVTAFDPMTAMTVRYLLVAIFLLPFVFRIPKNLYWPVFKVGMFLGFIYFSLFFWAAREISASLAAIILQLQVPFSLLFSMWCLRESPSRLGILGTILAFVGVLFAIGRVEWQGSLIAILTLFVAAASWGYGNVLVRQMKLSIDALNLNASIACVSLPFLVILMVIFEPHFMFRIAHASPLAWASMFYMALISTVFCYSYWFKLIHRYGVALVIPAILLVPICAIFSSKVFLHEALTAHLILGALITIVGVGLVILPKSFEMLRQRLKWR